LRALEQRSQNLAPGGMLSAAAIKTLILSGTRGRPPKAWHTTSGFVHLKVN
jgi:hypothetical protein